MSDQSRYHSTLLIAHRNEKSLVVSSTRLSLFTSLELETVEVVEEQQLVEELQVAVDNKLEQLVVGNRMAEQRSLAGLVGQRQDREQQSSGDR